MFNILLKFDTLYNAFQRVKENHGCAGVDGVTLSQYEKRLVANLAVITRELKDESYFPLPLVKISVDKGNGKTRNLCIASVKDRIVQTAILGIIEPVLEAEFEKCSFGYRKGLSIKHAIHKIKEYYEIGYRWIIDADIDIFF